MPCLERAAESAKPPKNSAITGFAAADRTRGSEKRLGSSGPSTVTIPTHSKEGRRVERHDLG